MSSPAHGQQLFVFRNTWLAHMRIKAYSDSVTPSPASRYTCMLARRQATGHAQPLERQRDNNMSQQLRRRQPGQTHLRSDCAALAFWRAPGLNRAALWHATRAVAESICRERGVLRGAAVRRKLLLGRLPRVRRLLHLPDLPLHIDHLPLIPRI